MYSLKRFFQELWKQCNTCAVGLQQDLSSVCICAAVYKIFCWQQAKASERNILKQYSIIIMLFYRSLRSPEDVLLMQDIHRAMLPWDFQGYLESLFGPTACPARAMPLAFTTTTSQGTVWKLLFLSYLFLLIELEHI